MSALVLTVLICLAWAGITALGYLRGGWREIVTLAAILLAYAVASEWAAPNGRDLAGVFGGNTYRSTTTIGLAYLFGGVALFGYFGGSRLPRPIPLSATERFVGGAVGLLNGGTLAALALRILRSSAFGPGDGTVLQDATLPRLLIGQVGYLLLIGLLGAVIAPFLSLLLVRQPPYTAEYTEDPMLQQAPAFAYFPNANTNTNADDGMGQASPMYAASYAPPAMPDAPAQFFLGSVPDPAFIPPGNATAVMPAAVERTQENTPDTLIPTAPVLPRVGSVPMWPTPSLPAPSTVVTAQRTRDQGDQTTRKDAPTTADGVERGTSADVSPTQSQSKAAAQSGTEGPPGFAITASQPLPVVNNDTPVTASPPAATPSPTLPTPSTPSSPVPTLPASTIGPAPFTTTKVAENPPMARGNAPRETDPHVAPAPASVMGTAASTRAAEAGDASPVRPVLAPPAPNARPITPTPDLIPAAPVLPRVPEMPDSINLTPLLAQPPAQTAPVSHADDETNVPAPSVTRARVARARVATARTPEPSFPPMSGTGQTANTNGPMAAANPMLQRPVQPGPNMHPCPVCDYPVRNGARFCPNCGSSQPPA